MSHPSSRDYIAIRGARQHNLKNFDLTLPKRRILVVTGPSGSGKSSLAFNTIFAEGQRRYMESLSSYARQFLERMDKPDMDTITGLSPAIAIEQRVLSKNPRSTVATQTEIYDHLRMLYAQIGTIISPISGKKVVRDSPRSVANALQENLPDGTRFYVTFPYPDNWDIYSLLEALLAKGFYRSLDVSDGKIKLLDMNQLLKENRLEEINSFFVVVDRLKVCKGDDKTTGRIADSVETAFGEGDDYCTVFVPSPTSRETLETKLTFSRWLERDGMTFPNLHPKLFSFNSPMGACPMCNGYSRSTGLSLKLVIPNPNLTLTEGALKPFEGRLGAEAKKEMLACAQRNSIDTEIPYKCLSDPHRHILWHGLGNYEGVFGFFESLQGYSASRNQRRYHSLFTDYGTCIQCRGARVRPEALYVEVGGKDIGQVGEMTIQEAKDFFDDLHLTRYQQQAAGILLEEIRKRLQFLLDVGLHYITLGRLSETLSGGESQRIRLATALGSALVGSLYVLDEPTIGLHPRDTKRLVGILKRLRDLGNTVIVVEHDRDMIRSADYIVDLGPESGSRGGELVFQGTIEEMLKDGDSVTGAYLSGKESIPVPQRRRRPDWQHTVEIRGAKANNLNDLDVRFPLGVITCVTGVSGSGKSTLVKDILYRGLKSKFDFSTESLSDTLPYRSVSVPKSLSSVSIVDQSPIGRSSRSNPVTYVKAFDIIRNIFAGTSQAKTFDYGPGFFSFNVPGGRCSDCDGEGTVKVEMQFLADLYLPCEECNGTRYSEEALHVLYNGKNIHDVLSLSVDEALDFFQEETRLCRLLQPLKTVGLGYLKLGQPAPTLSGGEAQRLKLANCLVEQQGYHVFYIFDEPTTGLHFVDISKLIHAFNELVESGHTVVIIEHNLDIIKCADHIIDLGPDGGADGGRIVSTGTPEDIARVSESHTGQYLAPLLAS